MVWRLAVALAVCGGINQILLAASPPMPRAPIGLQLEAEGAIETTALLGLGMRRLAADLALIRMIIYYGSPDEDVTAPHRDGDGHTHHHAASDEDLPLRQRRHEDYPRLAAMGKGLLDLDPSFAYGGIFSAGALAFNLNRPEEALEVLRYGLERDPKNHQYQAFIAAVGFHRSGDPEAVIRLLEPYLDDPDCPTMIKSMVAFLYRRNGRVKDAIRLYLDIYENSRDQSYRRNALERLKELGGG